MGRVAAQAVWQHRRAGGGGAGGGGGRPTRWASKRCTPGIRVMSTDLGSRSTTWTIRSRLISGKSNC